MEAENDAPWIERALALTDVHAADVLWDHPRSRVAENVVRACERKLPAFGGRELPVHRLV